MNGDKIIPPFDRNSNETVKRVTKKKHAKIDGIIVQKIVALKFLELTRLLLPNLSVHCYLLLFRSVLGVRCDADSAQSMHREVYVEG